MVLTLGFYLQLVESPWQNYCCKVGTSLKFIKKFLIDGIGQRGLIAFSVSCLQFNTNRSFRFFFGISIVYEFYRLWLDVFKSFVRKASSFSFRSSWLFARLLLFGSLNGCEPGLQCILWLVASYFPMSHWLIEKISLIPSIRSWTIKTYWVPVGAIRARIWGVLTWLR